MQSYHARLMSGQLPAQIDPIRLADEGVRFCGTLPGSEMSRLQELVLPNSRPEQVAVDLQFERTGQGVRRMHGTIRTAISPRLATSILLNTDAPYGWRPA